MPCDTRLKPRQTITERKKEVRSVVDTIAKGLMNGSIKAKVSPQGAIAFAGLTDAARDGVTDACVYRMLLTGGNSQALMKIAAAEQLAGRKINREAINAGVHSHDGGNTWHHGH